MLPRRLYELLPYIYVTTGIVSVLLINSRLVIIASILMIMAGVIVLSMRISSRRGGPRQMHAEGGHAGFHSRRLNKRSSQDRRRLAAPRFPLIDSAGEHIEFDRRLGDRRLSAV